MISPIWMAYRARTLPWPSLDPRHKSSHRAVWLIASVVAAIAAVALALSGTFGGAVALCAVTVALAVGSSRLFPVEVATGAVVVLGCGRRAAAIAAECAKADNGRRLAPRPRVMHVACTPAEAETYIRSTRCNQVVVVGRTMPGGPAPLDAEGRRPAVVSAEEFLGRVLLFGISESNQLAQFKHSRQLAEAYLTAKRLLDILLALAFGLALMPVLPLLMLLIKLDSPGPVLYGQTRVGLGGQPFRIYKFRTMRQDAEQNGPVWADANDSRITRVGRLLRLTRIDELPQVWNVLVGDMSFVGPRPERPVFTTLLEQQLPTYQLRHSVKPGLTGWAQVCFRYANSLQDARTKLEYDLYYVRHASLALDLKILARTIMVVLRQQGQ